MRTRVTCSPRDTLRAHRRRSFLVVVWFCVCGYLGGSAATCTPIREAVPTRGSDGARETPAPVLAVLLTLFAMRPQIRTIVTAVS